MNNLNKNILLGTVIGDALGLPVQFLDREVIAKNPVTTMVGYGQFDVPAGTWSMIVLYPFVWQNHYAMVTI